MFTIDNQARTPIYEQLQASVIKFVALGLLKEGDQLPPVRTTAMELGINPNTVQKAYRELDLKGIVYTVVGKGVYVCKKKDAISSLQESAIEEFKKAAVAAKEVGITSEQQMMCVHSIFEEV